MDIKSIFNDRISLAQTTEIKVNKWDYIKSKFFYMEEETQVKMKGNSFIGDIIFIHYAKLLIFSIYKAISEIITKKSNNYFKK